MSGEPQPPAPPREAHPLDHPLFPTHRKERDEWATPANSLIQKKHDAEQTEALPDLRSGSLHHLHLLPPAPLPRRRTRPQHIRRSSRNPPRTSPVPRDEWGTRQTKNIKPEHALRLDDVVAEYRLSLIHISEPTRQAEISYA